MTKRYRARLESTDSKIRVTNHHRQHIGFGGVKGDPEYQVRTVGVQGEPGAGINPRGLYKPDEEYFNGDVVIFNGASFIYINNNSSTGNTPHYNSTYWEIFAGEPEMRKEIDELSNGDLLIGKALPGSSTDSLVWSIKRVRFLDNDISITWADGNSQFDKSWDARSTYSYN